MICRRGKAGYTHTHTRTHTNAVVSESKATALLKEHQSTQTACLFPLFTKKEKQRSANRPESVHQAPQLYFVPRFSACVHHTVNVQSKHYHSFQCRDGFKYQITLRRDSFTMLGTSLRVFTFLCLKIKKKE